MIKHRFEKYFDILLFFFFPVFAYAVIAGFRILLLILVFLIFVILFRPSIAKLPSLKMAALIFIYILGCSIIVGEYHTIVNFTIFYLIYCVSTTLLKTNATNIQREKLLILSGLILSSGVILQKLLFENFGIQFGNILILGNRVAFTFTWQDSSYLSLYLAMLISIGLYSVNFKSMSKFLISVVMFLGIISTSARTGLLVGCCAIILWVFLTRTFLQKVLFLLILVPIVSLNIVEVLEGMTGRNNILHAGTRLLILENAFERFLENPIFGMMFAIEKYVDLTGGLPIVHNALGFILVSGGIVFLLLIGMLFFEMLRETKFYESRQIVNVILLFVLGLNFLPSPFGAYFVIPIFVYAHLLSTNIKRGN